MSGLTNKTSKSTRGKHTNKHCLMCNKAISGNNWSVHVKKVHNGEIPNFEKRIMIDSNYGKFSKIPTLVGSAPTLADNFLKIFSMLNSFF